MPYPMDKRKNNATTYNFRFGEFIIEASLSVIKNPN